MTMPDRIQITHQPRTMTTPNFRTLCAELLHGENPATPSAPEPGEAAHPTFQDAIKLAEGCHDYSGGHSGTEREAWHGAIDTVVDVLKRAAAGSWDGQLTAVYGVGEVAVSEPVAELDDQRREAVHQAVAEALGSGAYDCLRVWEAWGVGTMGPDDFALMAEDSDRVAEIADAAIEAIRAIPLPAPQTESAEPGEVEAQAVAAAELVPVGERLAGDVATHDEISENIVFLAGGIEEIADFLFEMEKYDWYATLNRASKHLQRLNRAAQSAQVPAPQAKDVALAGDRRSAESLQLAHESCRLLGTENGDCPDSEICWLTMLPCSHYENCDTPPAPQAGEVQP